MGKKRKKRKKRKEKRLTWDTFPYMYVSLFKKDGIHDDVFQIAASPKVVDLRGSESGLEQAFW